jgi:hypothetical protein
MMIDADGTGHSRSRKLIRRRWLERDGHSDAGFARIDKQVSDPADRARSGCRVSFP